MNAAELDATVLVALDVVLEERDWPDPGTLGEAIALMVRAQMAIEPTRDLSELVKAVRYQIDANPRDLTDLQLAARVVFDCRGANMRQRLPISLRIAHQRRCLPAGLFEQACTLLGEEPRLFEIGLQAGEIRRRVQAACLRYGQALAGDEEVREAVVHGVQATCYDVASYQLPLDQVRDAGILEILERSVVWHALSRIALVSMWPPFLQQAVRNEQDRLRWRMAALRQRGDVTTV